MLTLGYIFGIILAALLAFAITMFFLNHSNNFGNNTGGRNDFTDEPIHILEERDNI